MSGSDDLAESALLELGQHLAKLQESAAEAVKLYEGGKFATLVEALPDLFLLLGSSLSAGVVCATPWQASQPTRARACRESRQSETMPGWSRSWQAAQAFRSTSWARAAGAASRASATASAAGMVLGQGPAWRDGMGDLTVRRGVGKV
jgi:hypothetical protein